MKAAKRYHFIWSVLILTLFVGCQNQNTEKELAKFQEMKAIEAGNIEIIKECYKFLDEENLNAWGSLFAADGKLYLGSSNESYSPDDLKPFIKIYYTAFPDYKHEIENIFASGKYIVAQVKYTGTHKKTFMEIEPTGKKIDYKGIIIFEMIDGKISNVWGIEDDLTMNTQLGMKLVPKEAADTE